VFEIVQRSGGRIAVESEPGKGSRFDVTFACVEETKEHEREAIAVSHVNEPSLRVSGSVLVCEDDATVRTVICEYLEDLGCEVIRCASASEAHITAGVKKPAILVTDVMLPGGSGVQLSKALRTTNENLKVLLITGHTESEILKTIVPDENTMFLQKPFSAASLVSKLRELQRDGRGS
jgi:CheY-like chemotaxis protein